MAGLNQALKPGGVIVLEFPYGGEFIERTEFDTAYHEHVFYFTLAPLRPLFQKHGLEIFDLETLPIHGGSLRIYAGRAGDRPVQPSVAALAADEERRGVTRAEYYGAFARRVEEVKHSLLELLDALKGQGRRLAAYGASAKGSTLLNYCGIGAERLEFVADRSFERTRRPGGAGAAGGSDRSVSRQSRTAWSPPPEASSEPSGLNARAMTGKRAPTVSEA